MEGNRDKRWGIACGILGAVLIGVFLAGNGRLQALSRAEEKNQAEIARLTSDIQQAKESPDYVNPEDILPEKEKEEVSATAKELGEKAAQCQNAYFGMDASSEGFDANVAAMDACLGEGAKDSRVPWYTGSIPGTWKFVSDGWFKGPDKNVLWLCQNPDDNRLVAYATGVYNKETGLFTEISYTLSLIGSRSVESSGESPDTVTPSDVNDLAGDIAGADGPKERDLTEEEINDVKEAQQRLKEQMTGGN